MSLLNSCVFALLVFVTGAFAADSDFTPEEIKAVESFRPLVSSMLYQDFMKSDLYLMRYLRAEDLSLKKAQQRLQEAFEWRKAQNIDNILSEDFSQIEKCMPLHWIGHDREGRPLVFIPFGSWDIRRCVLAGHTEKLSRYLLAREVETAERLVFNATDPAGRKVGKYYVVADLRGYSLKRSGCIRCIGFMTSLTRTIDRQYPGLVYRVSMINAPKIFDEFLDLFRPLLTKEYKNIMRVYGFDKNEWGPIVARDLDLKQLPIALGGKRRLGENELKS